MSDKAETDRPVADVVRKTTCPAAHKGNDIGQQTSTDGLVSTCDMGHIERHDKTHTMCEKPSKMVDSCVVDHQNSCYSYGVKQKTNSGGNNSFMGQTDWMTPLSQPDWLTPVSQSLSDVCGDTVSTCDKSKCEDARLRQWRAAGIALKHALNHIARSQSTDCTRDTGRSDVTSELVSESQRHVMPVTNKATDAMNEMLEQSKTTQPGDGLNDKCAEQRSVGKACGSCGKSKGDTKTSQHGDSRDKRGAASTADSGDAPVNLQQLRERIRKITEKLPISTDQSDHMLVKRQHQSCKVTRQHHMADTDDSDVNDLCPDRKHDKEVRKHVKASRRRSSGGTKIAVSPVVEGQGHEAAADETRSGSSTDPGIVLNAPEMTSTATCPTSHNGRVLESDRTSRPHEAESGARKHLPHARCASGSIPTSRPKGLTEADSVANLADVESCTESFDVTEKSSDEREADTATMPSGGWGDASHKGMEGSSGCKDNSVVSTLFESPSQDTSLFTPDKESDDGFDDLCDLVLDTDESVEEEAEIHIPVEDIGDFPSGESSGNSDDGCDDGEDADDEFECDCTMCHNIGEAMWAARNEAEFVDHEEGDSIQHDVSDGYDQPFNFSLSEVCPLDLLLRQSGHHDILQAMFHNVITQMLTVYPDLMSDQVPPLVSDSYIDNLPSVSIKPSGEDDLTCPICLCNFETGDNAKSLPCQHLFHHLCIKVWIHKSGTCPVCRFILTPDS